MCANHRRQRVPGGGTGTDTFGWVADLATPNGGLAPAVAAGIRVGAWANNYAAGLACGEMTRGIAVARLSLCAIARPEIIQRHLDRTRAHRAAGEDPRLGWPPLATVLELLTAALDVTAGRRGLTDPTGHQVDHVQRRRGPDRVQPLLSVSRAGEQLAEVATVAQLAELVDVEQLAEQQDQDDTGRLPFGDQ